MIIETRHLRAVQAIQNLGSLTAAAAFLNLTQPALTHQMKLLEQRLNTELFLRKTKPLRLSAAGEKLLHLAQTVLPQIQAAEREFTNRTNGDVAQLRIGLECVACLDWLLPVIDRYKMVWPNVEIDINLHNHTHAAPSPARGLTRKVLDLILTTTPDNDPTLFSSPLFDYEAALICANRHPLAQQQYVMAEDFHQQTIFTQPTDRQSSDVFSQIIDKYGIQIRNHVTCPTIELILFQVRSGRGIAVLPDWTTRSIRPGAAFVQRPITPTGLTRRLYSQIRKSDLDMPHLSYFNTIARQGMRIIKAQ